MRIEHVKPPRCAEEFRLRKIKNDQLKVEAKGEVFCYTQVGNIFL